MKRKRRTEILIQGDSSLATELADQIIQHYSYDELIAPRQGLTMMKMRETAKNSLFYVGEVLVTEAKVEIQQQIGTGIVVGINEPLAKQLAIIDAAYRAELPETKEWEARLLEAEQCIVNEKADKQAALFETKVNFETMDV